jgi:hypothetical protein
VKRDEEKVRMIVETITWKGFFLPGYETCRLASQNSNWRLDGTAVFSFEQQPCQLAYQVICNASWHTISGKIQGWVGNTTVNIQVKVDKKQHWTLNGVDCPEVSGCIDLDLNFSPSTNLLPIRRLGLEVGKSAHVNAAWLKFPSFKLETLSQEYTRLDQNTYRYESAGGTYKADLKVDPTGFLTNYPDLWQVEASTIDASIER